MLSKTEVAKVDEAMKLLRQLTVHVNDSSSVLDMIQSAITEHARQGAEVVVIDQSSWISVPNVENASQEASEISRRLKQTAKRLKIVVIVLVQINRGGAQGQRRCRFPPQADWITIKCELLYGDLAQTGCNLGNQAL